MLVCKRSPGLTRRGYRPGVAAGHVLGYALRVDANGDANPGYAVSGSAALVYGKLPWEQARQYVWLTRSASLNWEALLPGQARICV